jgi:hypothetical protein
MRMASRYALASLFAAAAFLGSANEPVRAQCRLCSTPTTEAEKPEDGTPLRLEVAATLDFDRLVLLGAGNGSATLLPNGERSTSGTIATVSASAMVGTVTVHGEPNRIVRVDLPGRIDLYSVGGSRIAIDRIETDLSGLPKLDAAGNLSFRFGGRLQVSGDSEGEYRGDVPITVDYL